MRKNVTRPSGDWHRWFAWYPVKIDNRTCWLKTILRRSITKAWYKDTGKIWWEYQAI